jgi:cell pole-organizing protein PopZ
MEDILSSIKRIIAEDGEQGNAGRPLRKKPIISLPDDDDEPLDLAEDEDDSVLELTDEIDQIDESDYVEEIAAASEPEPEPAPPPRAAPRPARVAAAKAAAAPSVASNGGTMLSAASEVAARQALANLSNLLVAAQPGEEATLEGLVRAMLRPMLKDWLDANLPDLVESLVAKEIARITGRGL